MTAQPVEHDDRLDPLRILEDLPEDEQNSFLSQYQKAAEQAARDVAAWDQLRRLLRLWRSHADAMKEPGYWEAREAAHGPVRGGMSLEDAIRQYRPTSPEDHEGRYRRTEPAPELGGRYWDRTSDLPRVRRTLSR